MTTDVCPVCAAWDKLTRREQNIARMVLDDDESDRQSLMRQLWVSFGLGDMPGGWFTEHIDDCDEL